MQNWKSSFCSSNSSIVSIRTNLMSLFKLTKSLLPFNDSDLHVIVVIWSFHLAMHQGSECFSELDSSAANWGEHMTHTQDISCDSLSSWLAYESVSSFTVMYPLQSIFSHGSQNFHSPVCDCRWCCSNDRCQPQHFTNTGSWFQKQVVIKMVYVVDPFSVIAHVGVQDKYLAIAEHCHMN